MCPPCGPLQFLQPISFLSKFGSPQILVMIEHLQDTEVQACNYFGIINNTSSVMLQILSPNLLLHFKRSHVCTGIEHNNPVILSQDTRICLQTLLRCFPLFYFVLLDCILPHFILHAVLPSSFLTSFSSPFLQHLPLCISTQ